MLSLLEVEAVPAEILQPVTARLVGSEVCRWFLCLARIADLAVCGLQFARVVSLDNLGEPRILQFVCARTVQSSVCKAVKVGLCPRFNFCASGLARLIAAVLAVGLQAITGAGTLGKGSQWLCGVALSAYLFGGGHGVWSPSIKCGTTCGTTLLFGSFSIV